MKTITLMTAEAIASGLDLTRPATTAPGINLRSIAIQGIFSIHLILTGSGTAKVEYLLSHDGVNFLIPSSASDIVSAFTVGADIIPFEPEGAPYMRLKVSEVNAAEIVVTLILTVI